MSVWGEKLFRFWKRVRRGLTRGLDAMYAGRVLRPESGPMRNTGIILSHGAPPPEQLTLLVLGNGRGGTSMASGVLHHLGVFMGDDCTVPSYEDQRLTRCIMHFNARGARTVIDDYTQRHDRWGYKHPQALNFIRRRIGWFRNPRLVIIMKDVASIAVRHHLILEHDAVRVMDRMLGLYRTMIRFANRSRIPALIVSYEKAMIDPRTFIQALCEFAGLSPSAEQVNAAMQYMETDSREYRRFSKRKQRRVQNARF